MLQRGPEKERNQMEPNVSDFHFYQAIPGFNLVLMVLRVLVPGE